MGKNCQIKAAFVDCRFVTQEFLDQYDSISIHSALMISNEEVQAKLSGKLTYMNVATSLFLPNNTEIVLKNGTYLLGTNTTVSENPIFLIVNGTLLVEKDAESFLTQEIKGIVNGEILCPRSLAKYIHKFDVNGSFKVYPDEAELIQKDLKLDARFLRHAQVGASYYVKGKVLASDDRLDAEALLAKDITIFAEHAYLKEKFACLDVLFEMDTKIDLIPDDFSLVTEDLVLTCSDVEKLGEKLYVLGDVEVKKEQLSAIEKLSAIIVEGKAKVYDQYLEVWKQKCLRGCTVIFDDKKVLSDFVQLNVDIQTLKNAKEGVCIADCMTVVIEPEVSSELLAEKVGNIQDCACVVCTKAQLSTLQMLSRNVGNFEVLETEERDAFSARMTDTLEQDRDTVKLTGALLTL